MIPQSQIGARLALLLLLLPGAAASQVLTEAAAIQLLHESSRVRERRARVASSRTVAARQAGYPGPTLNASFEGAGRTEFYFVEQELVLGARDTAAKRQAQLTSDSERARADFDTGRMQTRMLAEFYRLVHAQERLRIILAGISEQERIAQAVRELGAAGKRSQHEVFLTEQSIAELRVSLLESEVGAARARAALADVLGDRVDFETLQAEGSLVPVQDLIPVREALVLALENRADLRSAAALLESSRLEASASTRGWTPSVKLQGGVKRADVGNGLAVGPYIAVSIPVPLPRGGLPRGTVPSAAEDLRREQLHVLRNQIAAEVRVAHDALRLRRSATAGYRKDALQPARELRESRLAQYREGELDALELLESVRVTQAAELRSLELQALAKAAEIEFRQVIGNAGL